MPNIYTEKSLRELAREIAAKLKGGENIYLSGELGAGKTTFTKLLLQELGAESEAKSPTFQLIDQHLTKKGPFTHIDLYRLNNPDDIATLNIDEMLGDKKNICIIEWPERGESILPLPHYHIHFEHRTPTSRVIDIIHPDNARD